MYLQGKEVWKRRYPSLCDSKSSSLQRYILLDVGGRKEELETNKGKLEETTEKRKMGTEFSTRTGPKIWTDKTQSDIRKSPTKISEETKIVGK